MNSLLSAAAARPVRREVSALALAVVLIAGVAGCSALTAEPSPVPSVTATPVVPYGDGVLTVGSLLPRDGDQTTADLAGVEAVVRDAQIAGAAGMSGLPKVVTQHRPLGAAGDGSNAVAVAQLAESGVDVLLVRADAASLAEIRSSAAAAHMAVLSLDAPTAMIDGYAAGVLPLATDDETARVRAEDPAVTDGALGVQAYRATTLVLLATVAAHDDGGESVASALPRVLTGESSCAALEPCLDTLANSTGITYTPVAGTAAEPVPAAASAG